MTRLVVAIVLLGQAVFARAAIDVVDDLGVTVHLSAPAMRIVSLAPHLTELLFALGVGDRITGTSRFSDYPQEAGLIPVVGDAYNVNVESVVAMRPDLVLAWDSGGVNRAVEKLASLGIPVYVNEAASIRRIADTVRTLGRLTGTEATADRLAGDYVAAIDRIDERYGKLPARSVFFQIADETLYTVNDAHLIGEGIRLCGASNIFGDAAIRVPQVSVESVVARNPDVIVMSRSRDNPWPARWAKYPGFAAKLREIEPGSITRPSLRMVDGIRSLCELIHTPGLPP